MGFFLTQLSVDQPEAVLKRVDLPTQSLTGFGGVVQLPLQFPAGGIGPGGLLLSLLQLPLQLLHAGVGFFHLDKTNQ